MRISDWSADVCSSDLRCQQTAPRQLLAEPEDRRVVGRVVLQRQAGEAAERQPIEQRLLHRRVRQVVPPLQQQHLEHRQRRIGRLTPARRMDLRQERLERPPIQQRRDLRQPVTPTLLRPTYGTINPTQLTDPLASHEILRRSTPSWNHGSSIRAKVSRVRILYLTHYKIRTSS